MSFTCNVDALMTDSLQTHRTRMHGRYFRDGLYGADVLGRNVYLNLDRLPTPSPGASAAYARQLQLGLLPYLRSITGQPIQ